MNDMPDDPMIKKLCWALVLVLVALVMEAALSAGMGAMSKQLPAASSQKQSPVASFSPGGTQ